MFIFFSFKDANYNDTTIKKNGNLNWWSDQQINPFMKVCSETALTLLTDHFSLF